MAKMRIWAISLIVSVLNVLVFGGHVDINYSLNKEIGHEFGQIQTVLSDEGELVSFVCEGGENLSMPGEPEIPSTLVTVLLPPRADLSTVACSVIDAEYRFIDGLWSVRPCPPLMSTDENSNPVYFYPDEKTIVDGRDTAIYGRDAFWPETQVRIAALGKLRRWKLLRLAIPVVRYNPVTGEALELVNADIDVTYSVVKGATPARFSVQGQGQIFRGYGRARVRNIAANYNEVAADYFELIEANAPTKKSGPAALDENQLQEETNLEEGGFGPVALNDPAPLDGSGYAIVTTNWLYNNSDLPAFVSHKQSQGWTVYVITEDDYNGGSDISGRPAFDAIHDWLENNYESLDLQYVLLVGKPHTDSGNVPMLMYDDDRDGEDAPTDYFYANLNADYTANNTYDIYWEVSVGRIPYYDNLNDLNHILQKTIDYQNQAQPDWRANVLLPMVPLDTSTPMWQLGEQIKHHHCEDKGIDTVRVYDENYDGCEPDPEYLRAEKSGWQVWRDEPFGLVVWSTHGSKTSASGIISTSNVSYLNDAFPAATFQHSCQNAWPENTGNLAYSILKNGGITTIGGTRNLFYEPGKVNFTGYGASNHGYHYAAKVLSGMSCGIAKDDTLMYGYEPSRRRTTLYGDPSTVVYETMPDFYTVPTDDARLFKEIGTPAARTFTLHNRGSSAVNWTASVDESWLSLSENAGTLQPGGQSQVTVTAGNILDGNGERFYLGSVTFTDTDTGRKLKRYLEVEVEEVTILASWQLDGNPDDASGLNHPLNLYNFTGEIYIENDFPDTTSDTGQCLRFDGVNDYAAVDGVADDIPEFSVSFWFRPDQMRDAVLLDKFPAGNGGSGWRICMDSEGKIHFQIGSGDLYHDMTLPHPIARLDLWRHVTCTYASGMATVIVNGTELAQAAVSQTPQSSEALTIGQAGAVAWGQSYAGVIDDIRIFPLALSDMAVKGLPGMEFRALPRLTTTRWSLDEGSGFVAVDSSGNDFNGTITGATWTTGKYGGALNFDGNDRVDYGFAAKSFEQFTVALWCKASVLGQGQYASVFSGYHPSTGGTFQIDVDGGYPGYYRCNGDTIQVLGPVTLDWVHLAISCDGTTTTYYYNGEAAATGNHAYNMFNAFSLGINRNEGNYYNGVIDDFRFFEFALSEEEINVIMTGVSYDEMFISEPVTNEMGVYADRVLLWTMGEMDESYFIYWGTDYDEVNNATKTSIAYQGQVFNPLFVTPAVEPYSVYYWRVDRVLEGRIIKGKTLNYSTAGSVKQEIWTGLGGTEIAELTGSANYPDAPDKVYSLDSFETPRQFRDYYGSRLQALLIPQTSGSYTFWVAGDDEVELWLSTDVDPAKASMIAYVHDGWTGFKQWDKYSSQMSAPVELVGGKAYYIMALHNEGYMGDHVAVAWEGPDNPTISVIDGQWLAPFSPVPLTINREISLASGIEGIMYSDTLADDLLYEEAVTFSKICGLSWLTVESDGTLHGLPGDSAAGLNTCQIGVENSRGVINEIVATLNIAERHTGEMGLPDLDGFSGEWLTIDPSSPGDLNASGLVDFQDWIILQSNWESGLIDGLVAHWNFNILNNSITKSSYGEYDGTCMNMDEAIRGVHKGSFSMSFDGEDDYIIIDGGINGVPCYGISGHAPRTVTAWIKAAKSGSSDIQTIVSWGYADMGQKVLVFLDEETCRLTVGVWGGRILGETSLNDNSWHHIAAVLPPGSNNISDFVLYLDGENVTPSIPAGQTITTSNVENVYIGAFHGAGDALDIDGFFKGHIDDLRIYDTALTQPEIQNIMQQ